MSANSGSSSRSSMHASTGSKNVKRDNELMHIVTQVLHEPRKFLGKLMTGQPFEESDAFGLATFAREVKSVKGASGL